MQALYKMVASFLSVALIFTSAAPSFAQVLQTPKVRFRVSASNSLEEAVTRQMARNQQQAEEAYWIERGEVLASKNSTYHYWEHVISKLIEARNQARGNIQEAVVCSENGEECIPALAYAWGGIHHGIKDSQLYYKGQIIDSTATDFAWLVSNFGIYGEADRKEAVRYFYDLIKMAGEDCSNGAFEYGSQEHRADQRIASEKQAKRCAAEVSVIPALAMITKGAAEQQKAAQTFYNLLKDKYDTAVGGAVIQACVTGLGVLGTQKSYQLLETFLTDDTIPSTAGNVLHGIGSPFETLAQNGLRAASNIRGGNSRFLNRINEQFQYLDKEEAKRQGFSNTSWQSEGIQYPYANVLEEVGAFLGQQSATNTYARALAKKLVGKANQAAKEKTNAAGVMHYPLVLGIMDGWREHGKTFIYEPAQELINFFYKGDWFDLNEGTQRRVHYKAYQFARSRGWTPELPKRDNEKIQRTIYNSRLLTIGFAGDSVLTVLMTGYLIKSIPALAKGIPQAVKTLSSRKAWVGAANYFKNAPKKMWARVKGGPRAKEIPLNPATRPAANARPATAAKPAKKPAQAKKQPAAKQQTSQQASQTQTSAANANGYTTVDMGVQNGRRTVAVATSPQQEASLAQQRVLYASTGDGFANVAKEQAAVADGAETAAQTTKAAQTAQAVTQPATQAVPRWIEVETTNTLGNTVKTWKPNPAHPEYSQTLAELSGQSAGVKQVSWLDKARLNWALNWKPTFQNMFKFGTSRYGLAAAGPGVAPLSSEAAIAQAADAPAVVQTIRAQQSMFIAEDFLRGGSGAAYRSGAVNPGGVTSQGYAAQMLGTATKPGFLETFGRFTGISGVKELRPSGMGYLGTAHPWLKAAALVPAGLLGASFVFGSDIGVTDALQPALAMAPLWGVPTLFKNRLLQARMSAEDGTDMAGGGNGQSNKHTNTTDKQDEQDGENEEITIEVTVSKKSPIAAWAANWVETLLFVPQDITEDYVLKVLYLYDRIQPFGEPFKIPHETPEQWANELEKFIDKYHRAPNRYTKKEITSQKIKNENRLAKATRWLLASLPKNDPNRQRIKELLASVPSNQEVQEIHTALQDKSAAQVAFQQRLDAQLDEIEREWAEEEDLYNAMRETSAAQASAQARLDDQLDAAAEKELIAAENSKLDEEERLAQDEQELRADLAQTAAAQVSAQARLDAELDAAEDELNAQQAAQTQSAGSQQANSTDLQQAISQFITLTVPYSRFEEILQDIFTHTNEKMTALIAAHKRGRRPSYATLWLQTAEELGYDIHELQLVKLAKDPASPLQSLFRTPVSSAANDSKVKPIQAAKSKNKKAPASTQTQGTQTSPSLQEVQPVQAVPETQPVQTITLSSLEGAISKFIELSMPFFLFENILQTIFTRTDKNIAAYTKTHKRGRQPSYATLWLQTAEKLGYDIKDLQLVKLAKDKNSPLQVLFNLRETARKQAPNKGPAQTQVPAPQTLSAPSQPQGQSVQQPVKKRRKRISEVLAEKELARQQRLATDPQFAQEVREAEEEWAQQAAKAQEIEAAKRQKQDSEEQEQPDQMMEEETELPTPVSELPAEETSTPTLLDGKTALQTYIPDWRIQLATTKAGFSQEQLDAIEQAFADTDEAIFSQDEDGNLIYKPGRNKDAWNYAEVFEHLLHETGIAFTKRQWGQIFGGKGIPDFTLKNYFTLLNLTAFLASQDKLPQKITATTKQEYDLRVDVDKVKSRGKAHGISQTDPIMQALRALTNANRVRREKRTPAQILAQLKQYMQEHNGQYPAYHAPAGSEEASLNNAITDAIEAAKKKGTDKTDPVIIELNQIKEDNRQFDIHKTALKWYASLKDWLATHDNKLPSQTSSNEKERQLRNGIYNTLATARKNGVINTDEAVIALNNLYENKVDKQEIWSTQKIYDEFVQYVTQHKRMPMDKSRLYYTLTARLYYHKKANKGHLDVNGNFIYNDPYLQKIYELKIAVQAAENGHLLLEKEGDHYVALAETEDTQESAENTQQAASAQKPQERTLILEINELTGQLLNQVGEESTMQREQFSSWLTKARALHVIVGNDDSNNALKDIQKFIRIYQSLGISQRNRLNDILATLGQYYPLLGEQEGGFFYKLGYKNYLGNGAMPRPENFYLQAERTGWSWESQVVEDISHALGKSGYLASLPPKRGETEEEAEKREDLASQIVFSDGVTIDTAKEHLNNLLQVFHKWGYTVRMGTHELGLITDENNVVINILPAFRLGHLHMHVEHSPNPQTETPVSVNIEFWVDAGPFTGPINKLSRASLGNLPDDKIALNYLDLFRSSLTKEGRQALIKIATPSTKK